MRGIKRLMLVVVAFALVLAGTLSSAGMISVTEVAGLIEPENNPATRAGNKEDGSEDNPWIIESWDDLVKKVGEVQGFFRLNNDIVGDEESELIITGGAEIILDLNGHSFVCGDIRVGEYDEENVKYTSLSIVSSEKGGTLEARSINVYGSLSLKDCLATITGWITGEGESLSLV